MSDETRRSPTDAELAKARESLDDVLSSSGLDLSAAELWEAPPPGLEDDIMAVIAGEHGEHGEAPVAVDRRGRWRAMVAAAAAAVVVLVGAAVVVNRADAPDWEVAMAAAEGFPGASGTVEGWNEPAGTRVRLELDGLPPAPDGYLYELWFSEGDIHISAGTFHGTEGVELWAGVTRKDFPRIWVTLEAIDDDESLSGDTVLDTG